MSVEQVAAGASESTWRPWLARQAWPSLDLDRLRGRHVVVLAAHPDDEVLGVGGLLAALARIGTPVITVWATDGEASHPGSSAIAPHRLRTLRREESRRALALLDVHPVRSVCLELPDSDVSSYAGRMADALSRLVGPDDVVVAPWRDDDHPDHRAVGRAAAEVASELVEYPVWLWHRRRPGDSQVPWSRARTVAVPDLAAKARAIDEFDTQVRAIGPAPEDAAVLPPEVLAHFGRREEVVFA